MTSKLKHSCCGLLSISNTQMIIDVAGLNCNQSQDVPDFDERFFGTFRLTVIVCRTTHICCSYFQQLVDQKPGSSSISNSQLSKECCKNYIFLRGFVKLYLNVADQGAHASQTECKLCRVKMRTLTEFDAWLEIHRNDMKMNTQINREPERSNLGVGPSKYHQVWREMGFFGVLWYCVRVFSRKE